MATLNEITGNFDEDDMEMEIDETVPNTCIIENRGLTDSLNGSITNIEKISSPSDVHKENDDKSSQTNNANSTTESIPAVECKNDDISQFTTANSTMEVSSIEEHKDEDDDVVVILEDGATESAIPKGRSKADTRPEQECEVIDLVDVNKGSVNSKCINYACKSGVEFVPAPSFCLNYYRVNISKKKTLEICVECLNVALVHYNELTDSFKNGKLLMECGIPIRDDLVDIDDSDSEDDDVNPRKTLDLDPDSVSLLVNDFDRILKKVMDQYNMSDHCTQSIKHLNGKGDSIKASYLEMDTMLHDVRKTLDNIHRDLYSEFRVQYRQLPPIEIDDDLTHGSTVITPTPKNVAAARAAVELERRVEAERRTLRKSKAVSYAELDDPRSNSNSPIVIDTANKDLKESGVIAPIPADLPPKGPIVKAALKIGEYYYSARFGMGPWVKVRLVSITKPGETVNKEVITQFMYCVCVENKLTNKTINRFVHGKDMAYLTPCPVLLDVGTRVIAIFRETPAAGDLQKTKKDKFYPGIIAEPLSFSNRYRYLIFFDDGYAQYVHHNMVHLIYEASKEVWKDMHSDSQPFIKKYLESYPERPMVKLRKDQTVRTEYNGKWWLTTVTNIDCSLVQMFFDASNRVEWIYRGSTRLNPMYQEELAASARNKNRILRTFNETGPYVQYTREGTDQQELPNANKNVACRAVARKSTSTIVASNRTSSSLNSEIRFLPPAPGRPTYQPPHTPASKVVYFTPRAQANTKNLYKPHTCSVQCKNYITYDVNKLKGYNPLSKPLLCGWNRVTYKHKGKKQITYKAPCGRFLRNIPELHKYLQITKSEMTVDLFDFDFWVHCLAEFVLERNSTVEKDMSNGLEYVQIPVVNYIDGGNIPFNKYNNKRVPKEGVPLNIDPEFLCGCDCEDDCQDKSKCQCWQLTLQGMPYMKNLTPDCVGYIYRRLPEPVITGIYECNSRCKCAKTCLNRVVQNPLQLKLQVFKTSNRGWGIRCLNDIPQGAFICIYSGYLLTEQAANEAGQNYGDEYFAELDYIESVEKMKEDYEEDANMDDEDDKRSKEDSADEEEKIDFRRSYKNKPYDDPVFVPPPLALKGKSNNPAYKTRSRANEDSGSKRKRSDDSEDETVTISDDEDAIREPSSFNPRSEADLDDSKPSLHKSVREMYGEDECVYIMDAKISGNIGRFLNHSCSPNVFVQNVFVDTHDVRFPWVAFFALSYIRAGTELTWNYNYDVGSVPGKVLYCHCGSDDCRGRLL